MTKQLLALLAACLLPLTTFAAQLRTDLAKYGKALATAGIKAE